MLHKFSIFAHPQKLVVKCFESRYPQKLVLQKTFRYRPLSAKTSSTKINAALITSRMYGPVGRFCEKGCICTTVCGKNTWLTP